MPHQPSFNDHLDAAIDAAEQAGQNPLEIHARIHERKRHRAHAKAKTMQPALWLRMAPHAEVPEGEDGVACPCHDCLLETLRAFWLKPLSKEEIELAGTVGAMEQLVLTVNDCFAAGDVEDAFYAALRTLRGFWALNMRGLGPIEGLPKLDTKKK